MAYWKNDARNTRTLDSFGLATSHTVGGESKGEFYELELGLVLDIVLDDKHPIFKSPEKTHCQIDVNRWPVDLENNPPKKEDIDYSWIGRALVRPVVSERTTQKDQLLWAYPLENNISEYPLINETVVLETHGGQLYYTRKVNYHNWTNNNLDFSSNQSSDGRGNTEMYSSEPYKGRIESNTSHTRTLSFKGYAGKYYCSNNRIRAIKRWEGDLAIESRHGQSIHMTAYDKKRENDIGDRKYPDYKDGGNPMILIRNRQRPILKAGAVKKLEHSPNPATITGTIVEKNVGGFIEENINHDGSSIHITSGQTISEWVTTCYKRMFSDQKGEEVGAFKGKSKFQYPILNGDQIVIQSDRLVLSSRYNETFHYSKKRYAVVTDNEYTVDAQDQIVLTTNQKTVINSPAIYLGEYDMTNEPVLLGQTTVNWLYELCNWLLAHCHKHDHGHVDAGAPSPRTTQVPIDPHIASLIALRDKLHTLLSRRVFVTGGGLAPGQNGASIPEGTEPVKISVGSGAGVPGGWKGANYRSSVESEKSFLSNPMTKGAEALTTR